MVYSSLNVMFCQEKKNVVGKRNNVLIFTNRILGSRGGLDIQGAHTPVRFPPPLLPVKGQSNNKGGGQTFVTFIHHDFVICAVSFHFFFLKRRVKFMNRNRARIK